MLKNLKLWMSGLLLACASLALVGCGGGGVVPGSGVTVRPLSAADFTSRKAVAYSPYRSNDRFTETVTDAHVLEDLTLLSQGGFKLIRLFDSSDDVAKRVLRLLTANPGLDIKVMLGVSVSYGGEAAEIARGIDLANRYPSLVVAVSVGNETAVSWSNHKLTPVVLASYIKQVRSAINQPVTTDDNWAFFAQYTGELDPKPVLDEIDFVSMHSYPLLDTLHTPRWEWKQWNIAEAQRADAMMNAAVQQVRDDFTDVRTHLNSVGLSQMPIIVGETGWKAEVSDGEYDRASPVNQKMYYDKLMAWMADVRAGRAAGPKQMVPFAAFDEPWKFNDDKWGFFDVSRKARLVVQDLYSSSIWSTSPPADSNTPAVYSPRLDSTQITANRYSVFADLVVNGESKLAAFNWYGWENGSAGWAGTTNAAGAAYGANFAAIVPSTTKPWGWGVFVSPTGVSPDLSAFASTGALNFSIKSTYSGTLKIGFQSTIGSVKDLFINVGTTTGGGSYGFARDGQWHTVTIPVSAILSANPSVTASTEAAKLVSVLNPFVLADVHATNVTNGTESIYVDEIYWSK
jgi:hypothetical protein